MPDPDIKFDHKVLLKQLLECFPSTAQATYRLPEDLSVKSEVCYGFDHVDVPADLLDEIRKAYAPWIK